MSKLLALLLIVVMVLHVVKPLGWPGLKRRRDVWKITIVALLALAVTIALREMTG